jgi:hypothetical protein
MLYHTSREHFAAAIEQTFADVQIPESENFANTNQMATFCELFNHP